MGFETDNELSTKKKQNIKGKCNGLFFLITHILITIVVFQKVFFYCMVVDRSFLVNRSNTNTLRQWSWQDPWFPMQKYYGRKLALPDLMISGTSLKDMIPQPEQNVFDFGPWSNFNLNAYGLDINALFMNSCTLGLVLFIKSTFKNQTIQHLNLIGGIKERKQYGIYRF